MASSRLVVAALILLRLSALLGLLSAVLGIVGFGLSMAVVHTGKHDTVDLRVYPIGRVVPASVLKDVEAGSPPTEQSRKWSFEQ